MIICASQVGNAIKSSLRGAALKSNNKEGARCIQVEITPTSSRISRNAVTSLSIRGHRWKRHGKMHTWGNECRNIALGAQFAETGELLHTLHIFCKHFMLLFK